MVRLPLYGISTVLAVAAACASTPPPPPAPDPPLAALVLPGVPLALARHRAATIRDVDYDLALDLTGDEWITGAVTIYFERTGDAGPLVLDFNGLAATELYANQNRVTDAGWVNGHIVVPEQHLLEGENSISARFMSAVGPAGASVIEFTESPDSIASDSAHTDTYFYSLLVPADASRLFPCFDQPDLKAVMRLELIAPPGSVILANAPATDSAHVDVGAWMRFQPTRPLSTYLFAFAAGPWATWSDSSAAVPMTLYARRSRADEVDADSLLATNRRALEWLERYFEFEYPFEKFDFLLAPAFPFGGMEHPGAVFYNESRFIFREAPTLSESLARDATIYHEVAHQWFGNLVTMRWFDDLWLKEGFSTYMAARMQEELNPGTGAWKTFYLQNKPLAYRVDATTGTTPLWQPLDNLDAAKTNYGAIVYNKAPSILKQLNFLVGEADFQRGLRRLVDRYAFGNITWQDLLTEMEEASGQSLRPFAEQYILRGGVPVVETKLVTDGGVVQRLSLLQQPAVEGNDSAVSWWPGRVQVRLGYADREDVTIPVAFTGDTTVVVEAIGLPAPDYVFSNDGDYGYGIFLLDDRSAEVLGENVGGIEEPLLRTLVWGALWDLLRAGRLPAGEFARIALRELPSESDEQIADFLLGRTVTVLQRYLSPADSSEAVTLRARFEQMLVEGMADASATYGLRKGRLDMLLVAARTPTSLLFIEDLLAGRRFFDGKPLTQPSRWVGVRTLLALGHPGADSILAAERVRDSSPEGERQAYIAGAARPTEESKAEYFNSYLDDPSLNEEWVTASLEMFNHPAHPELTLSYIAEALERLPWILQNRRIFFLPQWIEGFIGGHDSRAALAVVDEYLATHPDLAEDIRRKVLQARDELARTVEIRQGNGV